MTAALKTLLETRKFSVVETEAATPDGNSHRRQFVKHPGAVVILPILDDGSLVLIRNTRTAVGATLWELPAGTLEPDEPPAECAARELIEETGYRAARVEPLHQFYPSPGIMSERMYGYVATDLTPGDQHLEPGERIEVQVLDREKVFSLIDAGEIIDGKTLVCLLLAERRGLLP